MPVKFKTLPLICALLGAFFVGGLAPVWAGEENTHQDDVNNRIQSIFNNLETVGSAYNGGGGSSAARAALQSACQSGIGLARQNINPNGTATKFFQGLGLPTQIENWFAGQAGSLGDTGLNAICAALNGDSTSGFDLMAMGESSWKNNLLPAFMSAGQLRLNQTNLPFLTRLEIEMGTDDDQLIGSITTIQPLWEDKENNRHLFTQVSWYAAPDEINDLGFRSQYDTFNAGLAYRWLSKDQNYLYGVNAFTDYAPVHDNVRASIGGDIRTSQLAVSANRYFPITDWKRLDSYYEERAAAGWDLEVRGQVPDLPSWTASVKGYEWDNQDDGANMYGTTTSLEYSPVSALTFRVGVDDNSQEDPDLQAALRFNWRFDQPRDLQLKQKKQLAPVADYVYEKVHRENIIRVEQRRSEASQLTVTQTSGANTVSQSTGGSSLSVGQKILMPATLTVANTGGAVARVRFKDGSLLTAGQNTQVTIDVNLITLITGTIQYVSNGTIETVNTPGGVINLHGTDIDIVSNGTDSSVRVRDGSVDFVGTSSGTVTLSPTQAAESVSGVVGTIATGSADYIAHVDTVSDKIDRVAAPQDGEKVTPYPIDEPAIVDNNLGIGDTATIGLTFNDPVTVTSGTPRLNLTVDGVARTANYISGSGTSQLVFAYTWLVSETGETSFTVNGFDNNGATITGNGKTAVTTIADSTITLNGVVGNGSDVTGPSGYTVAFTSDPVNAANTTAGAFTISSAEVATTYDYTISSSGGGTNVTGSGTISTATQNVTGINLSGLNDGTLTISVTLTDFASNVGTAATDTVVKDIVAPTVSSVTPPTDGTYEP